MAKKEVTTKPEAPKTPSLMGSEMDRWFDELARGMMVSPIFRRALEWDPLRRMEKVAGALMPEVDVTETEKELCIAAELPGMTEKDIEIELSGNQLTVRGEKKEEQEEKIRFMRKTEDLIGKDAEQK